MISHEPVEHPTVPLPLTKQLLNGDSLSSSSAFSSSSLSILDKLYIDFVSEQLQQEQATYCVKVLTPEAQSIYLVI